MQAEDVCMHPHLTLQPDTAQILLKWIETSTQSAPGIVKEVGLGGQLVF